MTSQVFCLFCFVSKGFVLHIILFKLSIRLVGRENKNKNYYQQQQKHTQKQQQKTWKRKEKKVEEEKREKKREKHHQQQHNDLNSSHTKLGYKSLVYNYMELSENEPRKTAQGQLV